MRRPYTSATINPEDRTNHPADTRIAPMKNPLALNPANTIIALKALLVLNLLDATMTTYWVLGRIFREGNPLLQSSTEEGLMGFMLLKLILVSMCVWLLYRARSHRWSQIASISLTLVYSLLCGMHIGALSMWSTGLIITHF